MNSPIARMAFRINDLCSPRQTTFTAALPELKDVRGLIKTWVWFEYSPPITKMRRGRLCWTKGRRLRAPPCFCLRSSLNSNWETLEQICRCLAGCLTCTRSVLRRSWAEGARRFPTRQLLTGGGSVAADADRAGCLHQLRRHRTSALMQGTPTLGCRACASCLRCSARCQETWPRQRSRRVW